MPRLGLMATSTQPRHSVAVLRWTRLALPALALLAVACAQLSPQTSDLRPQYGFTPRAASAPQGLYGQLCDPAFTDEKLEAAGCPRFYGLLPAAVDDADAARLRILRAEIDDSGAPWLVTAAAYPVGAYALYRGLFGHGEEVRREISRLGLVGSAGYGWLKSRESPTRQQVRLAAVDALSCAMYGSVARYLYERKDIQGAVATGAGHATPSARELSEEPLTLSRLEASGDAVSARHARLENQVSVPLPVSADASGEETGLIQSRTALRRKVRDLTKGLAELRAVMEVTPAAFQRTGAYRNGCDERGASSTTCQSRGQGEAPVVSDENPEYALALLTRSDAEKELKVAGSMLSAAQGLLDRINNAPHELLYTVRSIEAAANKAVLATEADVDSLRRAVGGMKLGSQDLSGVLSQGAAPPPAPAAAGTGDTPRTQAAFSRSGKTKAAPMLSDTEAQAREAANKRLMRAHRAVRDQLFELIAAEGQIQGYLDVDRQRANALQGREDCQFLPPGLKLVVDPQDVVITLAPGATQRLVAQGGTQMPTVSLTGSSSLGGTVMRTEPDATAGRQSLTAVISPPANASEQDLQLVFRNGDLVQYRTVSIRKPAGASK